MKKLFFILSVLQFSSFSTAAQNSYKVGSFDIELNQKNFTIKSKIQEYSKISPGYNIQNYNFVEKTGLFFIEKKTVLQKCRANKLEVLSQENSLLEIKLHYSNQKCKHSNLTLFQKEQKLHFKLKHTRTDLGNIISILTLPSYSNDTIWGSGISPTHLNLNNHLIPLISQEQGHGRGGNKIVELFQELIAPGSTGSPYTTYTSLPLFWTQKLRGIYFKTREYGEFDFRKENSSEIRFHTAEIQGEFLLAKSPKEMLKNISHIHGPQQKLPKWAYSKAIIGLMGGRDKVHKVYKDFEAHSAEISAFWLQDWVGINKTLLGDRLQWNWKVNSNTYPNWDKFIKNFNQKGIKILGYINPYLYGEDNEMLKIAKKSDYLVKIHGSYFKVPMGGFDAFLVNLFNPKAYSWLKERVKEKAKKYGFQGWMADFSEAYPHTKRGKTESIAKHHQYIELWTQLNKEAIHELKRDDLFFFNRSAHSQSLRNTFTLWSGDHMSNFDKYDGMQSSLISKISAGMSGIPIIHSDTGGYVAITLGPFLDIKRTSKLLKRWIEMNTYSPILRTHEGLKPKVSAQVYQKDNIAHFSKWTQIFSKLLPYREKLLDQAYHSGLPLIRHMFIEFPDDENTAKLDKQYMFGSQFLIRPIFSETKAKTSVYLPKGKWQLQSTNTNLISKGQFYIFETSKILVFKKLNTDGSEI